ncbi:SET5 [Symbiodinium pilosum]|uniref:SET5 protein n=1 Tax=Symbiodinium pilosum TaxID=2952 RepID=A0A812MDD9_SYMPI|nr:SET5 [Symbiodinium pilosum]
MSGVQGGKQASGRESLVQQHAVLQKRKRTRPAAFWNSGWSKVSALANPDALPSGGQDKEEEIQELDEILKFNQIALSDIDSSEAQVRVNSDSQRSGLWLLASFINHSCCPNVQRVILHDRMVVRAAQDLQAGEELVDSYVQVLQPVHRRRSELERSYRFRCNCDRCVLESELLDGQKVQALLERAAGMAGRPSADGVAEWHLVEAAETLVAAALSGAGATAWAADDKSPAQELLLASFSPLFRTLAPALQSGFAASSARLHVALRVWQRFHDVVAAVLPGSEVLCAVSSSLFCTALLLRQNPGACRQELAIALWACHQAYGGGVKVWQIWHRKLFPPAALRAAEVVWHEELARHPPASATPPLPGIDLHAMD